MSDVERDSAGRWMPGKSGNPAGRPRFEDELRAILEERLAAGGRQKLADILDAVLARDDAKAMSFLAQYLRLVERASDPKAPADPVEVLTDDELLAELAREQAERLARGGQVSWQIAKQKTRTPYLFS